MLVAMERHTVLELTAARAVVVLERLVALVTHQVHHHLKEVTEDPVQTQHQTTEVVVVVVHLPLAQMERQPQPVTGVLEQHRQSAAQA